MREKIISNARVLLNHVALTALPRHVAPARKIAKSMTTPAPPQVKGPHGCNLHTGDAHIITKGPPNKDKGEKASSAL